MYVLTCHKMQSFEVLNLTPGNHAIG